MKRKSIMSIIAMFIIVITLSLVLTGCGDDDSYRVIKIHSLTNTCNVIREGKEIAAQKDMKIKNNDELDVKANSSAILKLDEDKFVCVKENSLVKFVATGSKNKTKTRLHVNDGGVIVELKEKLKDGEKFEIASSNSVMAIRGTQISFDVEKTTESITTTFSILTGNTEIFLYKDETMNSTTLIKDYMMSYTTSLVKSTDEIYKIYDSTKHNPISDEDLLNVYGVTKRPISNKIINEMVEIVNEFEKIEDELVNGVIEFDMDPTISYNVDPKTLITILDENKYTDMKDIKFLYSKTIEGTYNEFDPSNPLTPGTYFVKIEAGNAYKSDPYEFRIVKGLIGASIESSIASGINPSEFITVNGNYDNLRYVYSSLENGVYGEYDSANPLTTGTYYAKVENDCYTSNPMVFTIVRGELRMSLKSESITYGTNPNTNITLNGTYTNVTYRYCQTLNGTYREYSAIGTLSVGTWYVQAKSGSQYISEKLQFSVVPAKLNMSLTDTSVEYGTNPNTIINVDGTYSNIVYTYSDSEDGEFSEFSTSNPLNVGTWYVKADSNGQYISDVFEFEIIQKTINYSINDEIPYGTNPRSKVTLSGTYPNITYLYSDSIDGTYSGYNNTNPLEVGTYYIKLVINDNYTCEIKSFDVVQVEIRYSLSKSSVEYGTNPSTIITVSGSYSGTIKYTYAPRTDATFVEFDSANPLSVGTYYVKLVINDNYYSSTKQFSVTKKSFDFTIDSEIEYGENILEHITVSSQYTNLSYYYSTSSAFGTQTEITSTTVLAPRTYYVKVYSGTSYESVIKSFEIVKANVDFTLSNTSIPLGDDLANYITDSLNRNIMYSTTSTGTYSAYNLANALSVGTYYIKLENNYYTSDAKQISIVERPFTVSNITMNDNYITATIKTLETTGSKTFKVTYYVDSDDALTTELFNDGDRYYFQVMNLTDSSTVEFKYLYYIDDVLTDETDYYIIDTSNLEDLSLGTDFELSESRSAFALHTFNSDGTINLYYDLGFVNNTSYDLVCEVTYGTYSFGEIDVYYSNQKKVFTTSEFLTLTDLAYRSWAVCGIRVLKLVDGIYYVTYSDYDDEDYDYDVCRPLFDAKAAAKGNYYDYDEYYYEISASFNTVLEVNGIATVTVKVTDDNWDEVIQTITFTSDNPTRVVNVSCDEMDELYVTISYTRVISIKSDLAQKIFDSSHTSDMKINNASQLEEVAEAMEEKFGITIKGTFSRDYYLETYFEQEQW